MAAVFAFVAAGWILHPLIGDALGAGAITDTGLAIAGAVTLLDSRADLILVDRVQFQQVLLNLIRNAIEAMEESERRELVLSAARSSDDAVIVTVSDTGTGIREELRSQLFQPFFTTKQHGMGVKLSISRNIIEAHGGVLGAEPNPGGGTVFRMRLPAVTDEEAHYGG